MTVISDEPPMSDRAAWHRWLGARIRDRRKHQGLTQQQLGDLINMHRTGIVAIERGLRRVYALELGRIARVLDMTAGELVGEQVWDPPLRPADGSDRKVTAVYCARTRGVELVTELQWAQHARDDHVLWVYVRGANLQRQDGPDGTDNVYRLVIEENKP